MFVNSGSSANLVALSALTSPKLGKNKKRFGKRPLEPGDEVLTVASGFPTTVNPIIQNGMRPVVVDIELGTYDAISERLREAVGPKTRAIMMAHTLGNPFDLDTVQELCDKHGLWLVEDSCDALGSTYDGKRTGSFGDTATVCTAASGTDSILSWTASTWAAGAMPDVTARSCTSTGR